MSRVDKAFGSARPVNLARIGAAATKGSTIATSPEELIRRPQRATVGG